MPPIWPPSSVSYTPVPSISWRIPMAGSWRPWWRRGIQNSYGVSPGRCEGPHSRCGWGTVVTGVGLLGAGAILRTGLSIQGLTTAASLWLVAVGLAAGGGMLVEAVIATG